MAAVGRQAIIPQDLVRKLVVEASASLILVGGQALKVWVDRYEVTLPSRFTYVSSDVDFLAESAADREAVRGLARALGGRAIFPRRRGALTALVGQAIKVVDDDEIFNVDVLHRVFGADEGVRARAVVLRLSEMTVRVMHPLDVLKSRLDNLYGLAEKQNDLGKAQLRAAIEMARAFQRDAAATMVTGRARRPVTLRFASFIEELATGDAGKKVATRYAIHVADAIEPSAVPNREFREQKLPRLARWMSPERRNVTVRRCPAAPALPRFRGDPARCKGARAQPAGAGDFAQTSGRSSSMRAIGQPA